MGKLTQTGCVVSAAGLLTSIAGMRSNDPATEIAGYAALAFGFVMLATGRLMDVFSAKPLPREREPLLLNFAVRYNDGEEIHNFNVRKKFTVNENNELEAHSVDSNQEFEDSNPLFTIDTDLPPSPKLYDAIEGSLSSDERQK